MFSVLAIDRAGIDDPVGAISVHLVCGIWGTLAVGIFGEMAGLGQLWIQFVGVVFYGVGSVAIAGTLFGVIRATMGLRVTEEEETEGLDLAEHGQHAYDLGTGPGVSVYDEVTGSVSLRAEPASSSASLLAGSGS